MASLEATLISWMVAVLIFAISALPLYFAVSLFRKKVSFLKVLLVAFLSGIIVSAIQSVFAVWGALIAFIILIWIYREVFRLKWLNALLVWLLQLVFIIIFNILFIVIGTLLGITLVTLL